MTDKKQIRSPFAARARGPIEWGDLRAKAKADPEGMHDILQDEMDKGNLSWEALGRTGVHLRSLYTALKDIECAVRVPDPIDGGMRDVHSSLLALSLGGLTLGTMRAALEPLSLVSDQLVTDVQVDKPTLTIPNVLLAPKQQYDHDETTPYPLVSAAEERYDIGERPQGVRLRITEKMMRQDQIGAIMRLTQKFAMIPEKDKERHTLRMVTDYWGSAAAPGEPYALHLNKTGTALYSATANTPGTRAPSGTWVQTNALTGTTALENARSRLASMVDEEGDPIGVDPNRFVLLVPDALITLVDEILGSEKIPDSRNQLNAWGPRGRYRPNVVTTRYLDVWVSSSAWWMGYFADQFTRKVAQSLRFLSISGPGFVDYVRSGVLMEMSFAWDFQIGAVGYERVVMNTNGTTAPADE